MGNNSSRSTTPISNPQSPAAPTQSHGPATPGTHGIQPYNVKSVGGGGAPGPRRRESIQALSQGNVKGTAAPPSASLESVHPTPIRPHIRTRSQTITTAAIAGAAPANSTTAQVASQLRATHDQVAHNSRDRPVSREKMGNEQSHPKLPPLEKERTPPKEAPPPLAAASVQPEPEPEPEPEPVPTQPVDVPIPPKDDRPPSRTEPEHPIDLDNIANDHYFITPSEFSRPPRLPLPIEEEVHTPGSPIISPEDLAIPIDSIEAGGVLQRPTSVLSTTTAEEEDGELAPEFAGHEGKPQVPTLIEWEGPGERVYVTGTFAGWNRKFRLHRNGPSKKKNVLSAIVNIVPGTHHLKFIVDGDMRTSDKLPTAVDYTNILVNYLEVSLDDLPKSPPAIDEVKKSDPVTVSEFQVPPGLYPPQVLPPTPELRAIATKSRADADARKQLKPHAEPPKRYHQTIPRYLLDLDAPEESSRMVRANAAASNLPTPPTLPMFLSKSILNGTMPMKDDSSVLIMPNHTVLNHLATSSIKDNILATSATTRYKQKFLTTIMYKPKSEDGSDRERDG
ncbi:AMPKBI-domain-containing protein [Delitschia confertaspora ATCC 74209]|uniref:AMPKBI-domain-containing protein n=1 Tax=Delitschia confertaspora ATCC 74209 TaxID=1513339 RepID=A0A9P4N141_9PLEO|nr:AMPKBI-domain-containing protein [Delitschia confertaspora ATCC 74209]